MSEARECPRNSGFKLFPCEMVVAMAMGKVYSGDGCVISYNGELEPGVKECLDDYAGSLEELFYEGSPLPKQAGLYRFNGDARVHMVGGSDEPISFHGEFKALCVTN